MVLRKVVSVFALVAASLFGVASANAKAFYISGSSSSSTAAGSSCSSALSVAWFNNSSSWGSATHQISPGTTVFLCGTFTGRPGQQLLNVLGNGTSSYPITIKFLPGAVLSAPYWSSSGAISMQGRSYIVVDGGGSGISQNTANGTGRAYRQQTVGVQARSCTHCNVQNITIQNLYVRTSATDLAATHTVHCVYWHLANYLTLNHITCHDASWAFAGDGNYFTLSNSNIYHVDHGVASGPSGKAGSYSIHNNHFHDFANWDSPTNTYHHDGIHLWGQNGGTITSGAIYNNTFDGDFGVNITAHVFLQDSVQHVAVYNNMGGGVSDVSIQRGTTFTSTGVNHNVYRDLLAEFGDRNGFSFRGKWFYSLSQWQAACHCDYASKLILGTQTTVFSAVVGGNGPTVAGAGVTSVDAAAMSDAVNLSVISAPTTTDPEFALLYTVGEGNGLNLSDLAVGDLSPLAVGINGAPRPAAGPWNVGPF